MPMRFRFWLLQWMRLGLAILGVLTLGLSRRLDDLTLRAEGWFLDGEVRRRMRR